MELKEFKQLDAESKANAVNKRLSEIKNNKEFRCDDLDFTYATAVHELKEVGFERIGDSFQRVLSSNEIKVLQNLAREYDFLQETRYSLGSTIKEYETPVKKTSFDVDADVLAQWQDFVKEHKDFSAVALHNAALVQFMRRYKY